MASRTLTLAFCAIILVASSGPAAAQAPQDPRAADELDICELVLRERMMDWITTAEQDLATAATDDDRAIAERLNFKVFFVSVDDKDPSEALLDRLSNIPREIKKLSDSEIAKAQRMPVIDKKTGQYGIRFYVNAIHWSGANGAKVDAGYHCDGLCAVGITYRLQRVNGRWTIKSKKMNWIS